MDLNYISIWVRTTMTIPNESVKMIINKLIISQGATTFKIGCCEMYVQCTYPFFQTSSFYNIPNATLLENVLDLNIYIKCYINK